MIWSRRTEGRRNTAILVWLGWLVFAGWVPSAELFAIEEVRASHLLVATKGEAETIRKEIVEKGGELTQFVAAARKYSKDPTSKILGGDVGWFGVRGSLDPVFTQAAFQLEVGQLSEPVKSSFGWHLIFVTDRRDRSGTRKASLPQDTSTDTSPPSDPSTPRPGPGDIGPPPTGNEGQATSETVAEEIPLPQYEPTPRTLVERKVVIQVEPLQAENNFALDRQDVFENTRPVELQVTIKNDGKNDLRTVVPELLVFGFEVTRHHDGVDLTPDFSTIAEPEEWLMTLKPQDIIGRVVAVNEFFKDITPSGRFELRWNAQGLFNRLEAQFPKILDVEGYAAVKGDFIKSGAIIDKVRRDPALHWNYKRVNYYNFAVFERPTASGRYYARLKLRNEATPVVIELNAARQLRAVQQFMNLALEGFYDRLNFYDVREGDYIVGGCPQRTGTGAPGKTLRVTNTAKLTHERGTVSFVSRSLRREAPVVGGEVGSIFFICLKEHPEWDDEHVPFGTVISGMEVLDAMKTGRGAEFETVDILHVADLSPGLAAARPGGPTIALGNPTAAIATSKGELEIVLYEDQAPNTVANFITLAEDGFFDKGPDDKKQTFFNLMADQQGRVLVQTGSPTNGPDGGPGYRIPDESRNSSRKCVAGALVMTKMWDEASQSYIPDSAGSQFFICLRDIPFYDYEGDFTVFGMVTGGKDVLDKLVEGDTIESVKITKKRKPSYDRFRKLGP